MNQLIDIYSSEFYRPLPTNIYVYICVSLSSSVKVYIIENDLHFHDKRKQNSEL